MKSIETILKRTNKIIIILLIIILITLLFEFVYSNIVRNKKDVISKIYQNVNTIAVEFLQKERNERDMSLIEEKMEFILDNLKKIDYAGDIDRLKNIQEAESYQDIREQILGITNYLSNYRDSMEKRLYNTNQIFLTISIVFLIFIIVRYFIYARKTKNTFEFLNHHINQISKIFSLDKKTEKFREPKFKEENSILKEVEKANNIFQIFIGLNEVPLSGTLEDYLPKMAERIKPIVPFTRMALAFERGNYFIAEAAYSENETLHLKPGFKESKDTSSLSKIVKENKKYRIINDFNEYIKDHPNSNSTKLLLNEGMKSSLTVPIIFKNKCYGFLFFTHNNKDAYNKNLGNLAWTIVNGAKQNLLAHYIIQRTLSSFSKGFTSLVEGKDNETGAHVLRVAQYSRIIADKLNEKGYNISQKFIREMELFAPLHDIGKVGIPDSILMKPGKLTEEEFETMKDHVLIGVSIMSSVQEDLREEGISLIDTAIKLIYEHHEKFDGSGYPLGKKGRNISLAGRIMAITDVFDALLSKRPYKEPFPFDEAVSIIKESSGNHFDPTIVEAFLDSLDEIESIYRKSHKF